VEARRACAPLAALDRDFVGLGALASESSAGNAAAASRAAAINTTFGIAKVLMIRLLYSAL